MPHLLIAGSTGTGKSVCVNALLASILLRATPEELRLVMIDPKKVELNHYEGIPHLLTPVVTNMKNATAVLSNIVGEMEARYELMGAARARNLNDWNKIRRDQGLSTVPHILVVIDELADLMMVAPGEVEDAIIRLAQKSRAVGIHLLLATQRPSVDVITGMIKARWCGVAAWQRRHAVPAGGHLAPAALAGRLCGRGRDSRHHRPLAPTGQARDA
jgi:DNA segregation ATPase FtsK/SpoIIIE, S-DNA-T family